MKKEDAFFLSLLLGTSLDTLDHLVVFDQQPADVDDDDVHKCKHDPVKDMHPVKTRYKAYMLRTVTGNECAPRV